MKLKIFSSIVLFLALSACAPELTTEEYLQRGIAFMDKKEWKSAVIEFKNGIKKSPQNAEARFLLGKAYLQTFSSDASIKEFKKAIDFGIDINEVKVYLGRAYALRNKNDEILTEINVNKSLSESINSEILALRAEAFLQKGSIESALKELTKAKELDENNVAVRLAWAKYESINGNVENQLKWLSPLLELNIANAWSQKGAIERIKSNLEEAERSYTKAIEIRKFIHHDHLARAKVRVSLKKFKEAKLDLESLKAAGFIFPAILHTEGVIAYNQENYDLSLEKTKTVLGKFKEYPPSLFLQGMSYFQKGKYLQVINYLSPYLAIQPENSEARVVLAISLLHEKKYKNAIKELEILYKLDERNPKISSLLSRAYVLNGEIDKGLSYIQSAIKQNPNNAEAQLQLGSILIENKKDIKSGQNALYKAIKLDPNLFQANLSLYISYMQSKVYDQAAVVANKMITSKPEESLAYNLLAHTYLARGNNEKALEIYEAALKMFPSDPLTSSNIANYKIQNNQINEVKPLFLDVLKKYPNDSKTLLRLAILESKLGNQKSKIEYLVKAVKINPTDISPKIILANEYLQQKDYKEAINTLRNVSEEEKSKKEVMVINAQAKMGLKEYDYSLTLWKKLIANNPKSASAHYFLGRTYGYLNKKEQMKQALETTVSIQHDHLSAGLILARLALIDNNEKEFKKYLNHLNQFHPNNVDVKFLNAKLKNKEGNYQSAISTLEDLLKGESQSEIVIDLAKNKWASGDVSGAIIDLELWLTNNPDDVKALMLQGQLYIAEHRYSDANKVYLKVDKLVPNSSLVLNNLAWLYLENNNISEGLKLAKKALSLNPNSPYIKDTLAMLLLGDNKALEALPYAKEAADDQPDYIEIQMNYAKVLIATGDKSKAKSVLSTMRSKSKNFDQRQEIQTLLNSL